MQRSKLGKWELKDPHSSSPTTMQEHKKLYAGAQYGRALLCRYPQKGRGKGATGEPRELSRAMCVLHNPFYIIRRSLICGFSTLVRLVGRAQSERAPARSIAGEVVALLARSPACGWRRVQPSRRVQWAAMAKSSALAPPHWFQCTWNQDAKCLAL